MFIIKHKKIFLGISAVLVTLSLASLLIFGLNPGIDFKGGALTEVSYTGARPHQGSLKAPLEALSFGTILLQPTGDRGYIVKTRELSDEEHSILITTLSQNDPSAITKVSFNSIGPSVGRELTKKAIIAVILVSLAIISFIAFAFRKVSDSHLPGQEGVPSWKYGVIAIVTLLHDVIIPSGLFAALSYFFGVEMDTLFVVAILTILGLSVSDTIVIFDRIRENLHNNTENKVEVSFKETVGKSLYQSYARSINTSLTVIIVLLVLFFFGPESTKYFALTLTVGMFLGAYSSIFLASPLLVLAEESQRKK